MGEAPTVEMETVPIARSIKVLACLFGFLGSLLLVVSLGGTSWITEGVVPPYHTHGIFESCKVMAHVDADTIEAEGPEYFECTFHENISAWLMAVQGLLVLAAVVTFVSFVVIAVGLCSAVRGTKFGCYRVGIYGYFIAVVAIILSNIVFPLKYFQTLEGDDLALGWAYGLAWGIAVLLLAGALMLILDKGEELTEREKMPDEEDA